MTFVAAASAMEDVPEDSSWIARATTSFHCHILEHEGLIDPAAPASARTCGP